MLATRQENIHIILKLNKDQADLHDAAILTLMGKNSVMLVGEGDTLTVRYKFSCEYFGNVEARLAAICNLVDTPELVVSADIEELKYGESLLVKCVDHIRELQAKLC